MRWSLCFFLACGAVAGAFIARVVPAGLCDLRVHDQEFRLVRPTTDQVEVTPARWFFLPFLFGDFDLQMDLSLGEGAEVDLLLRQVEPRLVDDQQIPFAGRFTVLRLSTKGDGVGWRTREQALFGPTGNGVGLAPGFPATVWIEARGRMLRANVAGKWQPWCEADDSYGMFTIMVRGGNAELHDFLLTPRQQSRWQWSPWTWAGFGLLGALVAAAFGLALGEARPSFVVSGVLLLLWAHWWGRQADLDLAWPDPGVMLLALTACLSAVLVLLLLRHVHVIAWAVPLVFAIVAGEAALRGLRHDTREVDAVFGPDAGNQLSEAHAQLVRGHTGLHDVGREGPHVFLLGGELIYDRALLDPRAAPGDHLELLVGRELRARLRKPVDVPCLPTIDGHAAQQWRMFEQFFTGYRPEVIVLGVGAGEHAVDESTGEPRSSPRQLAETVRKAQEHCQQHAAQLVLFAAADLAAPLLAELRKLAGPELPLVVAEPEQTAAQIAAQLAAVILPALE